MSIPQKIFQAIKKGKRFLLPVHLHPDGDGVGSVLAFCYVLEKWQKEVLLVSSDPLPENFSFLPLVEKVGHLDFSEVDLGKFDYIIALDSSSLDRFTNKELPPALKNLPIINIDHHLTNTRFGQVNLVLPKKSSTCEILYDLFSFWKVKIDKNLATLLCFGILTDTGFFRFPNTNSSVLRKVANLLDLGASLSSLAFQIFRQVDFRTLKYYSKVLENMKIDKRHKFVWSKISGKELEKLGVGKGKSGDVADLFFQSVKGTKFGFLLQEEGGKVYCSLRSRTGFDVSKIAQIFGGGGHKLSAGFLLKMPLEKAEKKVLAIVRKSASF